MKRLAMTLATLSLAVPLAVAQAPQGSGGSEAKPAQASKASSRALQRITREVRHELVMLPYYGVFDNLQYMVSDDGTVVTLLGQVTRPSLKSDAERAVKRIEGVERVDNQIEVLPPSGQDDRIRRAAYQAIYSDSRLHRYSIQAVPPIHIIVNRGHITLEGSVATMADKQAAEMRANGVSGVFSVKNNLQVEQPGK